MGFVNEGEGFLFDLLCDNVSTVTDLYVGLVYETPGETDTLADISEEDDPNYSRQVIPFSSVQVDGDNVTYIENDSEIQFPAYSDDCNYTLNNFIVATSQDNTGILIGYGALDSGYSPLSGEVLEFPAQSLKLELD